MFRYECLSVGKTTCPFLTTTICFVTKADLFVANTYAIATTA
ncbi:MAG: hypothetical protein RMZ95_014300 [Nostoc sp. DedQUE07]